MLQKFSLSKEQKVQECDATMLNRIFVAGNQKNIMFIITRNRKVNLQKKIFKISK